MKDAIEILRQTFAVDEIILKGSRILLIITFSFVFYWLGLFIFSRFKPRLAEKEKTREIKKAKRVLTLVALFKDIYKYVLFFLCGFMILREIGIDAAPLLATAGVVGLAIGFGAQSLVKDMISGFFILFEDQYSVSDFVYLKAGPFEAIGLVEEFGLRMTKIRDINGNLHFVPNGSIVGVSKYSRGYLVYNLDLFTAPEIEEEKLKSFLEQASREIVEEIPLLAASPKILSLKKSESGRILTRLNVLIVPFQERAIEQAASYFSRRLKEELKLEEVEACFYALNEKALAEYRRAVRPR